MKLTKEECLEAYEFLDLLEMNEFPFKSDEHRKSSIFKKMINEYFNLKPYELKDLKPGMWVWDNKAKEYFKIVGTHEDGTISVIVHDRDIPYQKVAMLGYYEPNRFFARKIKED